MKKILITGKCSYIGTSFKQYIGQYSNEYQVDELDVQDNTWKEYDFTSYDVVFNVAGIAHVDVKSVKENEKKIYYEVNTDLAISIANKAKQEMVKQFIQMSSIIVYGNNQRKYDKMSISKTMIPRPTNFYGDSKLQADKKIFMLNSSHFKVCILRPPMIYGKSSKGNYPLLAKLAIILPVFPNIKNKRSILFIGNLCYFIKQCIDYEQNGIFTPQNEKSVSTAEIVKAVANVHNKRIYITNLLNPFVYLCRVMPGKIGEVCDKAFGNLYYEKEDVIDKYTFISSIKETERKKKFKF